MPAISILRDSANILVPLNYTHNWLLCRRHNCTYLKYRGIKPVAQEPVMGVKACGASMLALSRKIETAGAHAFLYIVCGTRARYGLKVQGTLNSTVLVRKESRCVRKKIRVPSFASFAPFAPQELKFLHDGQLSIQNLLFWCFYGVNVRLCRFLVTFNDADEAGIDPAGLKSGSEF